VQCLFCEKKEPTSNCSNCFTVCLPVSCIRLICSCSCSEGAHLVHGIRVPPKIDHHTKLTLLLCLQMRGSIPLYWVQDTASVSPINPKPAIQLQQYDPHYSATRLHFQVKHRNTHTVPFPDIGTAFLQSIVGSPVSYSGKAERGSTEHCFQPVVLLLEILGHLAC